VTTDPVAADTPSTPTDTPRPDRAPSSTVPSPDRAPRSTLTGPPTVGLKEAARLCRVSVATVRRRREQLEAAGATAAEDGWTIPIPALVAVGLLDRTTPPGEGAASGVAPATTPGTDTTESPALTELREQLDAERRARAEAEHRARLAEAIAQERGRALEDTRLALRALTAGPSAQQTPPRPAEAPPTAEQPTTGPNPHPAPSERPRGRLAAWRDRRR
jgi:hypothetical protein